MKNNLYVLLITALLVIMTASFVSSEESYGIDGYSIDVTPIGGELAHEYITISFTTYDEDVDIKLDYSSPLESLDIDMEAGDTFQYIENSSSNSILFSFPESGNHIVEMNFDTIEFSSIDSSRIVYSPTFSFPVHPENFSCKLVLQEDMSISHPLVPAPNKVYAKGENIIVEWNNVSDFTSFYIICAISLSQSGGQSLYLAFLLIPGILVGYLLGRGHGQANSKIQPKFKTDEAKVWNLLEGGAQTHKELVDRTGFSKSKITRILQEMEDRGVISREKYKKKNIISIKGN